MSWKSVKNFLILLLVAVNILLAFFAYNYYINSTFTDSATAERASTALAKGGLNVPSDMLSVKNDNAETLYTTHNREDYVCLAASILFGKEADGIYMLPNGVRAETLEGETALIGYDMSIEFTAADKKDSVSNALKTLTETSGEATVTARTALESKLALPAGSIKERDCKAGGSYIFVTLSQAENGLELYGMNCVFGLEGDRIVYADGKYFFEVPEGGESAQLLDRVNILFSEKERGVTGTLTDIELCYTLYEEADSGRMLFVPSYALTYADGTMHAVNAISKKLY
ncbi:MAG: hypothetical protein IJN48_04955 [Clostridia bacterium]|nr:hypothetical protein [Clostridia bacterium]